LCGSCLLFRKQNSKPKPIFLHKLIGKRICPVPVWEFEA
jgi:hypothetical protein